MQHTPNIKRRAVRNFLLMFLLPFIGFLIPYLLVLATTRHQPGEPVFRDGMTPLLLLGGGFAAGFVLWLVIIFYDLWRFADSQLFQRVHIAILLSPLAIGLLACLVAATVDYLQKT
ncbi:MAG: hypothetical protein EOP56_17755 [Sphingobacteriales bacterium]|nr:MAG: hypothetical protein EOP56_17755 [Sphingobacteriales bacterium]